MRTKKEKTPVFLTMFTCCDCSNNLTNIEALHGQQCNKCIAKEKGINLGKSPEITYSEDRKILDYLQQWEQDKDTITLKDRIYCNYCGKDFYITMLAGKYLRPYAIIKTDNNNIVYNNGQGTTEGKDVFNYAVSKKLIKIQD